MKKLLAFTLAMLMALAVLLPLPTYAAEVTDEAATDQEPATEETTAHAETDTVEIPETAGEQDEPDTEPAGIVTDQESETTAPDAENEAEGTETAEAQTSVAFDEWLYDAMKQATPEQMEMVEEIVMGGLNALDKLGIKGFDRLRIWVEYNTSTVMVIALFIALVAFLVASILQKKGFAKKADILNTNAIEMYNEGQNQAKAAHEACKTYADRADESCRKCADAAQEAAARAQDAVGQVTEERALLIAELDRNAKVNAALCEMVGFLLQCSDLSQTKRDEAEAIFQKGLEAMQRDEQDQA